MKYLQFLADYMCPSFCWFFTADEESIKRMKITEPNRDYSKVVYLSEYVSDLDGFYLMKFSIPKELIQRIDIWDSEYQSTLADYPPDSCFSTLEDEERHWQEGLKIAQELAQLLKGKYRVEYYVNGKGKIWIDVKSHDFIKWF